MENNNINGIENVSGKSKFIKFLENLWELVKFAIIALLIVIPIRMFIAQPFLVSGESMLPTFHDKEYLIIDELSYLLGNGPHRGDVVVFKYPLDTKRYFIKRIIGLPNEEIDIKSGKITIINKDNPNGFVLDEPYINENFDTTENYKTGDSEYFVLGDNRNRSSDSRYWGLLPRKLITGRTFLRLFPVNEIGYLPGYYKEIK